MCVYVFVCLCAYVCVYLRMHVLIAALVAGIILHATGSEDQHQPRAAGPRYGACRQQQDRAVRIRLGPGGFASVCRVKHHSLL